MTRKIDKGRLVLVTCFILSLTLNAVVLGAGVRLYQGWTSVMGQAGYTSIASPEIRRHLNAAIVANKDDIIPPLKDFLEARMDTIKTGSTKPFDAEATLEKMLVARKKLDVLAAAIQDALLEGLEASTLSKD